MREISGRLHITQGSIPFEGDHLTLRLDDGRSLSFLLVDSGPEFTIDPTGILS